MQPGLEATVEERVSDQTTAASLGSGDVSVLGTPAVLALVERAAVRALEGALSEDQTSVGAWVELSHSAPTPIGARVRATSRLIEVDGRKLTFEFSVTDPGGEVATGRHRRVIVDREKFLRNVEDRSG
jgi:predicted thioesterase